MRPQRSLSLVAVAARDASPVPRSPTRSSRPLHHVAAGSIEDSSQWVTTCPGWIVFGQILRVTATSATLRRGPRVGNVTSRWLTSRNDAGTLCPNRPGLDWHFEAAYCQNPLRPAL